MGKRLKRIGEREKEIFARCLTIIGVAAILAVLALEQLEEAKHFADGTYINDVDCSKLTVEEARLKLEQDQVMLAFADGSQLSVPGNQLGRSICDTSELEKLLMKQKDEKDAGNDPPKAFELSDGVYKVELNTMKSCLEYAMQKCTVPISQKPENAYLRLSEEGYIEIVPEVQGNFINVEDAVEYANKALIRGDDFILFTPVTEAYPEIRTNNAELALKADELNKVLRAEIRYTLSDGSTHALDHDVTAKWLKQDESGEYYINLEEELTSFLEGLNQKVQELGATMEFIDREGKVYKLPVEKNHRNSVDIEAERIALMDEIEYGGKAERAPIYARFNSMETFTTRAELCRAEQKVYFYLNGEYAAEVDGDPTITGTANTKWETPLGVFFVIHMQSPKTFKTYGGESDFWIQFTDDGIGFHDASGRAVSEFVPETYLKHGSHGCGNLLHHTAEFFYEHSYLGMPVIVY